MKINYISDLHLERNLDIIDAAKDISGDVLVIAGDVVTAYDEGLYLSFFDAVTPNFNLILTVLGNHEYYTIDFESGFKKYEELLSRYANVKLLSVDNPLVYKGVNFIGDTLWSDIVPETFDNYAFFPDYRHIYSSGAPTETSKPPRITPAETTAHHMGAVFSLFREVDYCSLPCVVISHHAPSAKSSLPIFNGNPCNGAFYTNLELDIKIRPNIKLWIHGHMHNSSDYYIGETRVVCNPCGNMIKGYRADSGRIPENIEFDLNRSATITL